MNCICGHSSDSHTPRLAREGKPRTVLACTFVGCGCLEFKGADKANRAKLSPEERDRRIRSLERQVRQIQLQIQELKG